MGWKPGGPQIEIGEIPHKGVVSEQELANLQKNAPDVENPFTRGQRLAEAQEKAVEDFINTCANGDRLLEVYAELEEDLDEYYQGFDEDQEDNPTIVLDPYEDGFAVTIMTAAQNAGVSEQDLRDLACTKALGANCFYFAVDAANGRVLIAPIQVWDETSALDHREYEQIVAPEWLEQDAPGVFRIIDGRSMAEARREMKRLLFRENFDLVK